MVAETVDSTVKRAVDLPKPKAKEEEEPTE